MNECGACGQDFGSVAAFDEHRVGEHDYLFSEGVQMEPPRYDGRRCLDVSEMEARGFHRDRWNRWALPAEREPRLIERVSL